MNDIATKQTVIEGSKCELPEELYKSITGFLKRKKKPEVEGVIIVIIVESGFDLTQNSFV